jgi:L-lactate dehydrogenase complex protein LldG
MVFKKQEMSRDKILTAVKHAQPGFIPLPEEEPVAVVPGSISQFQKVLESIGGRLLPISDIREVIPHIENLFPGAKRVISAITTIERYLMNDHTQIVHRSLDDLDVAIIKARLGVAENGALWVTEEDLKIRVLPFICEHLVAIVEAKDIVADMHQAYEVIGQAEYSFGTFIAGPSKTADIEQSLVLGAHGPKTMTVLLLSEPEADPAGQLSFSYAT